MFLKPFIEISQVYLNEFLNYVNNQSNNFSGDYNTDLAQVRGIYLSRLQETANLIADAREKRSDNYIFGDDYFTGLADIAKGAGSAVGLGELARLLSLPLDASLAS